MAYKIVITYVGVPVDADRLVAPICRIYTPDNSYVDTEAYENTVYDTNVGGFGSIDLLEPFATTSIPFPLPLAQFKLAVVAENGEVEFEVFDYKEAFYYKQLGAAMYDQGFRIEVTEIDPGTEPEPEPEPETFVAVTGIEDVPTAAIAGTPLTLSGTVAPAGATNTTIVWSVKDAGTTGATIAGNILTTTDAGTVEITATIADGTADGTDYTDDFTITVADDT